MVAAIAAVLLSAAAEPPKIAVLNFGCHGPTISNALCEAWVDRLVARLSATGVKVVTQKDLVDVLGVERQRQLTGCLDEESSCAIDMGQALAVDGLLSASIVQPLDGYLLSIKVVRPSDGTRMMGASRTAANQTELLEVIDAEATRIGTRVAGRSSRSRVVAIAGAAAGALLAATGAVLFGLSKVEAGRLRSTEPLSSDGVQAAVSRGSVLQPLGAVLFAVGVPLAIAGTIWALLGFDTAHSVALWVTPGGAAFAFGGAWP
jgi:hypothetical protein